MPGPTRPTSTAGSSRREVYKVQPPRPPNSWILYRSHQSALLRQGRGNERIAQSTVSQLVSEMWKREDEAVRSHFEKLAEEAKLEHQRQYPDYRFCPQKKEDKLRAKGENKKSRAKKAKARDATPSDASTSASVTPAMPPVPALPSPFFWSSNMAIPEQYMLPYPLEAQYGPYGPSPPLSAAPSPALHETSQSPQPSLDEASSSSPSVGRSPSSESLPTLLPPSARSEQPLNAPLARVPSSEHTTAPQVTVWNADNEEVPTLAPQNLEVVKLNIPIVHTQNYPGFQQFVSDSSQLDRMLSTTDGSGVFNMSTVDSSNIVVHPLGELEVAMGDRAPTVDYNGQLFVDYDYLEFQRQMASFTQADSTSSEAVVSSPLDELESLFHHPNSAEVEAYTDAQQRQHSAFTQEIMNYLNFDAIEGSIEDPPATSSLPIPTAVVPQQMHLDNTQDAAAMAIFTQMTNVPTPPVTPTSPYMPPAIYSPTRRVGGSWKPPFYIPGQTEDSVHSWTFSTN